MVKRSIIDLKAADGGDNAIIPISMVDRGRGDSRNILEVLGDRGEQDMYRNAVETGILSTKYDRNQFDCTITFCRALKWTATGE